MRLSERDRAAAMRIAFVTPEYVTEPNFDGGLANYIHRVSLALLGFGHQPLVVVAADQDESFVADGIEVHRVRIFHSRWIGGLNRLTRGRLGLSTDTLRRSWLLRQRLRELHRRRPLSLIQYPNYSAPGVFRLRGVPSILRLSSYMPLWQAHGTPQLPQELLWESVAIRRADALFGPSWIIAEAVQEKFGRPVEVIETPFVLEPLSLDEAPYREHLAGQDYLLFFGAINLVKGLVTIAGAIREVLSRYPGLHFVFIGEGGVSYQGMPLMEYVRQQAGVHRDRVIHLDKMRHAQLYPILARARAVVLPSRIDNFPNACLEAMAHRRVVIGTRGASFEQLLRDGESGFLCERDDARSLAAAIHRAMQLSEEEQRAMGEQARERVQELRPENVVRDLLAFYERVLAGGGRAALNSNGREPRAKVPRREGTELVGSGGSNVA